MRVLITGGCGMIGFHAALLYRNRGFYVDVMDNLERSALLGHEEVSWGRKFHNKNILQDMSVNVYPNDVSVQASWDNLGGHDLIIHMAAQCGVPTSIANPRRDYEVNLQGTFNALEYARKHKATFIMASTNKVYPLHDAFRKPENRWEFIDKNWQKTGFPIWNDLLMGSRTPYGWSKYAADTLCQEYHHTYGLKTGIFRMSCIYGPHQFGFEEQGWATWFVIAKELGLPLTIYGDGDQVRDILYVEDCIKAYDAFVSSDKKLGLYNLGGGVDNTVSLNEWLKIIDYQGDITFKDWRPSDQKTYVSDIRPVVKDLNWQPTVDPKLGADLVTEWVVKNKEIF